MVISRPGWALEVGASLMLAAACGPDVGGGGESDATGGSTVQGGTDCADGACPTTVDDPCQDGGCDTTTSTTDPCGDDGGSGCAETVGLDPCQDFECAPGECVVEESGPSCTCPTGFASIGYACLECTPATAPLDIDVPMIRVGVEVLMDGAPPPRSPLEGGRIVLRRPRANDIVVVGNTWDAPLLVEVVPGTYEVHYEWLAGGAIAPINERAFLGTVVVDDTTEALSVDVPTMPLAGSFSLAGIAPPASEYENGEIWLEQDGAKARLGETREGEYSVVVVPGHYELHYGMLAGGSLVPENADALLGEVELDAVDPQLDVDVPLGAASGAILLDGQVPPDSALENGEIVLVDAVTNDAIVLAETREATWTAMLVPGQYSLRYRWLAGGAEVPINQDAWLGDIVVESLEIAFVFDVDVPVVTMSGDVTIAGAAVPDPSDAGDLRLVNYQSGDVVELGATSATTYDIHVVPSEYSVVYWATSPGATAPVNEGALIDQVAVLEDPTVLDLDVPTVQIAGAFTLDGMPFPGPPALGTVELRDFENGGAAPLGSTVDGTFQTTVIPGVYDLAYGTADNDGSLPINALSVIGTVDIGVASQLDIDVPAVALSGAITVAGQAPPPGPEDVGVLQLRDVRTLDAPPLGDTAQGSYAGIYVAGTYVLVYSESTAAGAVPANTEAPLVCLELAD